jgi:hypothetical protein
VKNTRKWSTIYVIGLFLSDLFSFEMAHAPRKTGARSNRANSSVRPGGGAPEVGSVRQSDFRRILSRFTDERFAADPPRVVDPMKAVSLHSRATLKKIYARLGSWRATMCCGREQKLPQQSLT